MLRPEFGEKFDGGSRVTLLGLGVPPDDLGMFPYPEMTPAQRPVFQAAMRGYSPRAVR